MNFKPPFVFQIDPYWPTFKIIEQGGYELIDLSFSDLSTYDFQNGYSNFYFGKINSPGPINSFEYKGDCVASCPQPYYHEIRGLYGRCVLNC